MKHFSTLFVCKQSKIKTQFFVICSSANLPLCEVAFGLPLATASLCHSFTESVLDQATSQVFVYFTLPQDSKLSHTHYCISQSFPQWLHIKHAQLTLLTRIRLELTILKILKKEQEWKSYHIIRDTKLKCMLAWCYIVTLQSPQWHDTSGKYSTGTLSKWKKTYHCEANIYKYEEMKLENIKINTLLSKINLGLHVYITTMVSNRVWSVNRKIHCFPIWKQVLAQKLTNGQTKKRKSILGAAYRAFSVLFRVAEYLSITQKWEELSPLRK